MDALHLLGSFRDVRVGGLIAPVLGTQGPASWTLVGPRLFRRPWDAVLLLRRATVQHLTTGRRLRARAPCVTYITEGGGGKT
jgi:hypothetical protein